MTSKSVGGAKSADVVHAATSATVFAAIVALQVGFALLLSAAIGVWAWILFYVFTFMPAIGLLISLIVLISSLHARHKYTSEAAKFESVVADLKAHR